jgi:hypothetical protein
MLLQDDHGRGQVRAAIIFAVWAAASVCNAAAPSRDFSGTPVSPHGQTVVRATLGGTVVIADFITHEVSIGRASDPYPERPLLNCTYSRIPCSLVDSLEIRTAGKLIDVPRSAFGALSDVSTARLALTGKHRFALTMIGGDAAAAYEVELIFDKDRVIERVVTQLEGEETAERTVYYDTSKDFE